MHYNPHHRSSLFLASKNRKKRRTANQAALPSFDAFLNQGNNGNAMGSGIETALLLLDKKRQLEWKKDMKRNFPFIPNGVLDVCLDSLAEAFSNVAPKELKKALRPGGLEKVRPEMENTIVNSLQDQTMITNLPLSSSDKKKLLHSLVKVSLDFVLQDAKEILADPNTRLQNLEEQRHQITKYMSTRQIVFYQIRYHPVKTTLISSGTVLLVCLLYNELRATSFFKAISSLIVAFASSLQTFARKLLSGKRKVRRVKGRIPRRL